MPNSLLGAKTKDERGGDIGPKMRNKLTFNKSQNLDLMFRTNDKGRGKCWA